MDTQQPTLASLQAQLDLSQSREKVLYDELSHLYELYFDLHEQVLLNNPDTKPSQTDALQDAKEEKLEELDERTNKSTFYDLYH